MSGFGRDPKPVSTARSSRSGSSSTPSGPTPWDVMEKQLRSGETLIWADRPVDLLAHAKSIVVQSIFGIPFLAFSVFWTYSAMDITSGIDSGGDGIGNIIGSVFPLFGLVFVVIGLGLVLSPVWAALKARRLVYGATDQRLMIRNELPTTSLRSFPLVDLGPLERQGAEDGPGTIYFAKDVKSNNNSRGVSVIKVGFIGINDPMRLEQEIENLRKKSQKN